MVDLIPIYEPVRATGKPRLVFIHGLDGEIRSTWMSDPNDEKTLWPRWIGEDTGCPVWLLGYNAGMTRWKADAMPLPLMATAAIERLSNESSLLEGPLILIGHSLGGLVIKTALQHGMSRDVDRHKKLANNIKGIAFVGTPHFGSKLATLLARFSIISRANPQISDLQLDNAHLETLNQYFLNLREIHGFKTRIFMETQPYKLPWWWGRLFPGVTIVPTISADAHIPGEIGIPIDADHISICKPKDRRAAIHASLIAFIDEIDVATLSLSNHNSSAALSSENIEALPPEQIGNNPVHLAFSTFGVSLETDTHEPICASVCLVTDAPDRLCWQLHQIQAQIQKDSLVNMAAKKRAKGNSLQQLVEDQGTRAVALRELAVMSFSAYMYYCFKDDFDKITREEKIQKLLVEPLLHRLSKKGEYCEQIHSNHIDISTYLRQARQEVLLSYNRSIELPRPGESKYGVLEELAELIAKLGSGHLAEPENAETSSYFESFRTRTQV